MCARTPAGSAWCIHPGNSTEAGIPDIIDVPVIDPVLVLVQVYLLVPVFVLELVKLLQCGSVSTAILQLPSSRAAAPRRQQSSQAPTAPRRAPSRSGPVLGQKPLSKNNFPKPASGAQCAHNARRTPVLGNCFFGPFCALPARLPGSGGARGPWALLRRTLGATSGRGIGFRGAGEGRHPEPPPRPPGPPPAAGAPPSRRS